MTTVKINGMSCQHCVASVKEALEKIPGIAGVEVDLAKKQAVYEGNVDEKTVKSAISAIGFEVAS